jgi:DNA-binding transcriptional regulator of glucitol operon
MYSTRMKAMFIVLVLIVFAVTFALEARQVKTPSASTTAGLDHGSHLR